MRVHFLVYLVIGPIAGAIALVGLPRIHWLDSLVMGWGLLVPLLVFAAGLAMSLYWVDSSPPLFRLLKLLLLFGTAAGTFMWVLSRATFTF